MNVVVMFPYPSGSGLHMGHYYNYAIIDSYCRWLRRCGHHVNQPFGYDAFGLPAENFARKIGGDPRHITYTNIANFREQLKHMNTQYEEKLITSDPSYYKWTQWLFTKLLEKGLAYKAQGLCNWCPSCETVLANEQVVEKKCERCNADVVDKEINQWYFRITAYKDRLIQNLHGLNYPASTIKRQRDWLENLRDWSVGRQRKWGCPIPIQGESDTLDTFVCSSFYYLRYLTTSESEFLPKQDYKPVDLYVGGSEHACMHLIYARFIHMFLYDIGVVPQEEPFNRVIHQGMITKDGSKMSKSVGNVVDPTDYDSDELRMGLMFLGPYFEGGDWNEQSVVGVSKFLKRWKIWLETSSENGENLDLKELEQRLDRNVRSFKFNLIVSDFMKFYNQNKKSVPCLKTKQKLYEFIQCFAPSFA